MNQARELCRTRAVPLVIALALGLHDAAWAAAKGDDDLASRFATAPEAAPDQQQLVLVEVNGVSFGSQLVRVAKGGITLPPATARTLGIAGQAGEVIELASGTGITSRLDEAQGTLSLTVPVSRLAAQRFAPEADAVRVNLSPETWGAYIDYDLNARHDFGSSATEALQGAGGTSGRRSSSFGYWGGFAELRVLGPDAVGGFGWAYDSTRLTRHALGSRDNAVHFAIRMAALKSMRVVGCGARGRNG